jgi:hypothetical protein
MIHSFDLSCVADLREQLNRHPIYRALRDLDDVRAFMGQHVYSVWDFMSLAKTLQQAVAPAGAPWVPVGSPLLRRFINEIVLEEESDEGLPDVDGRKTYLSHFELYCQAMREVGADDRPARAFVAAVPQVGIRTALRQNRVPMAARWFMEQTFDFIESGQPHVVAAAFALGREQIIPGMFRALLQDMQIGHDQAPAFHYYLERHIHLDEDHHGPLSLMMLDELCESNPRKLREAGQAARQAIAARIEFWDGVLGAIESARPAGEPRRTAIG